MRQTALTRLVAAAVAAATVLVAGVVTAAATARGEPNDDHGAAQAERNARTVVAFYTLAFNDKQPELAVAKYVGDDYIQHNPLAGTGKEAFIQFVRSFTAQFPETHVDIRRVVSQHDLVMTHSKFTITAADRGSVVADVFRLERGKIVEHWDVIQAIPETTASGNPVI